MPTGLANSFFLYSLRQACPCGFLIWPFQRTFNWRSNSLRAVCLQHVTHIFVCCRKATAPLCRLPCAIQVRALLALRALQREGALVCCWLIRVRLLRDRSAIGARAFNDITLWRWSTASLGAYSTGTWFSCYVPETFHGDLVLQRASCADSDPDFAYELQPSQYRLRVCLRRPVLRQHSEIHSSVRGVHHCFVHHQHWCV